MWLLLLGPAAAMPWWVDDAEDAAALQAALETLWPEEAATISVAEEPDAPGIHLIDSTLTWVSPSGTRQQDGIPDWPTAVVLVRSWSERLVLAEEPPSLAPPEPEPQPTPPAPPQPAWWSIGAFAGPASRRPDPSPAYHFSGELRMGHTWAVPLTLDFDPAERVPMSEEPDLLWLDTDGIVVVRRVGALVGVSRMVERERLDIELSASGGVRQHRYFSNVSSNDSSSLVVPTVAGRIRLWTPGAPYIGGGVMVSYDGPNTDYYPRLSMAAPIREQTVAVEIGARWRKKT